MRIDEIKGIIFGGASARFWLSRKHMISELDVYRENKRPPFYAWECITLMMESREIDLVIQSESDMNDLLAFLIMELDTVDCSRNTAQKVYNEIRDNKIESELEKKTKMSDEKKKALKINPNFRRKHGVKVSERLSVMRTTLFRYKMMRIRIKISFEAFL